MKKTLILILYILSFSFLVKSQSLNTTVEFNKMNRPALMIDLPYSPDVVEGFIIDHLKKTGYNPESKGKFFWKQNKINGFYTFKDVIIEGIDNRVNLYFKIDRKSKNAKDESILYLVATQGDHFISSDSDEVSYNATKNLVDHFTDQSASYKLDLDVSAQEKAVKEAELKMDKMVQNEKDLNRKIDQLQNELRRNKADQENQKHIIENEQRRLESLKATKSQ